MRACVRTRSLHILTAAEKACLFGQSFARVCLDAADFGGADLRHARFVGSSLVGCDFQAADLRCCVFSGCNLRDARFVEARLEGSRFLQCQLQGAIGVGAGDLRGAAAAPDPEPGALQEEAKVAVVIAADREEQRMIADAFRASGWHVQLVSKWDEIGIVLKAFGVTSVLADRGLSPCGRAALRRWSADRLPGIRATRVAHATSVQAPSPTRSASGVLCFVVPASWLAAQ